jgi:hypothetical protein
MNETNKQKDLTNTSCYNTPQVKKYSANAIKKHNHPDIYYLINNSKMYKHV